MRRSVFSRRRIASTVCSTAGSRIASSSPTAIPSPTSPSGRGCRATNGRPWISTNIPTSSGGTRPSPSGRRCRRAIKCRRTSARSRSRREERASRRREEAALVSHHRCACVHLLTESGREHQGTGSITLLRAILTCAALAFASAQQGKAQDVIERPVTIYVAGTAGGGIDLYARLVGRHIARHIPGNPAVTVQVMPGAGGIRAANYLAEQARPEGTAMTAFAGGPILEPLIGARNPGYDMSRFTWIGAITKDVGLCIAWAPFLSSAQVMRLASDLRAHVSSKNWT